MRNRIVKTLDEIRSQGNYRSIRYLTPLTECRIIHNGREYLNLCSNSYLSIQNDPRILDAIRHSLDLYGSGTCSSRSVSGSIDLYGILEEKIAAYKKYLKGLMFSNGYMANIGIISTLTEEGDVIFSDELNHSSLIHSMRLSRAKKVLYRHRDPSDLEKRLKKEKVTGSRFIVTETVFSMDGDIAPLGDICALRDRYGAELIVDDAHGTGVFGPQGTGVEELFGMQGKADVHMATFGKALGSFGAFVLADPVILEYLVNRAKTFMYTTALPAATLAASTAALDIISTDLSYKDVLWENIEYMRQGLLAAGFDLKESKGPIIPIVVGEDAKAIVMQSILMEKGLFLQAIRPPTVPAGTSRLRLTVIRGFQRNDMDYAIDSITEAGKKMNLV